MILFTDNEGCLTPGKGRSYDLAALAQLRAWLAAHPALQLVLCTGRSVPYCEALLQAAGLQAAGWPMICEGGAVLYHPAQDRLEVIAPVPDFSAIMEALPQGTCYPELGKAACLSLYPSIGGMSVPELGAMVEAACLRLGIECARSMSAAAVDITAPGVDKGFGVRLLSQRMGWDIHQCGGFGDAANDLPMLDVVGWPMAPANATEAVRERCRFVSAHDSTLGLLDACGWFLHAQDQG